MDLKEIPTREIVDELLKRLDEVEVIVISEGTHEVKVDGPGILLKY